MANNIDDKELSELPIDSVNSDRESSRLLRPEHCFK